jgi:hypothetical protein
MSHTKQEIEIKAQLLLKVLEKHDPAQLETLAFKLMQKHEKNSEEFKALAALYEVMSALK